MAFDVALHVGTLVAVLVYFRNDLWNMSLAMLGRPVADAQVLRRWVGLLAVATLPVVFVGGLFADRIEVAFSSVPLVGAALLLTAALLWFAARCPEGGRGPATLGLMDALVIGVFQAVGIVPGVSRSGSTIAGALLRGIDRDAAARFAFLMAVPAITGATLKNLDGMRDLAAQDPLPVLAGMAAAAITGWLAIEVMMRLVRSGRLRGFALYCLVLGSVTLLASALSGVLGATV